MEETKINSCYTHVSRTRTACTCVCQEGNFKSFCYCQMVYRYIFLCRVNQFLIIIPSRRLYKTESYAYKKKKKKKITGMTFTKKNNKQSKAQRNACLHATLTHISLASLFRDLGKQCRPEEEKKWIGVSIRKKLFLSRKDFTVLKFYCTLLKYMTVRRAIVFIYRQGNA